MKKLGSIILCFLFLVVAFSYRSNEVYAGAEQLIETINRQVHTNVILETRKYAESISNIYNKIPSHKDSLRMKVNYFSQALDGSALEEGVWYKKEAFLYYINSIPEISEVDTNLLEITKDGDGILIKAKTTGEINTEFKLTYKEYCMVTKHREWGAFRGEEKFDRTTFFRYEVPIEAYVHIKKDDERTYVSVYYKDIDSGKTIKTNRVWGDIGTRYDKDVNSDFQREKRRIEANFYRFVEERNTSGTYGESNWAEYRFERVQGGAITVNFLNKDTNLNDRQKEAFGNPISDILKGKYGEIKNAKAKDIPHYETIDGNLNKQITLNENPQTITFEYKLQQASPLTIRYVDQDGNSIPGVNDQVITGRWGDEHVITPRKDIPLYTLIDDSTPKNEYLTDKPKNIVYHYQKKPTAEPVLQNISLGKELSSLDAYKFVKNVKLGDKLLSPNQYTVQLINALSTDTIGTKILKTRVILKENTAITVDVDVPIVVGWGNSVVFGSSEGPTGRTLAAFTLYTETNPYIIASQGGTSDDNDRIGTYYAFDWFNLTNKTSIQVNETNSGDKFIKANSYDLKKDKLKVWGKNQKQLVNYGDIVRAWQLDPNKNWLYENEQQKRVNKEKQSVYYEITKTGYRPLKFNQLTTKKGTVPIYATKNYLDEHVSEYVDLAGNKDIRVKGFSTYPDTTSSGDKKAKILVEETLTTQKKVQYEYAVTVAVGQGSLTYTVPTKLEFKDFFKSRSEQIVQRKNFGDRGLLIKDDRGSNSQGNWKLTAKVSSGSEGIAPYLIYRNEKGIDSYLNGSAVHIYTQEKQTKATAPLKVEISGKWNSTRGILLKVPSKNNLAAQEYSTIITWNLVEGP